MLSRTLGVLATLTLLPHLALSHTWSEALNVINDQGTLIAPTGYQRNFVPRNSTSPAFKGDETQQFQKLQSLAGASACASFQATQTQTPGYPVLSAYPGAKVANRYAENGHVTIEQVGRPPHGGPVWIYGTANGATNPLLADVQKWTADGSGGNKQGVLLAKQNFDDGRCYEVNGNAGSLSPARQAASPIVGPPPLPDYGGLECQNNFAIPNDAPVGKLYTIFWVWDFSLSDGTDTEWFTTCMDIEVGAKSASSNKAVAAFNSQQPVASAAVPEYFSSLVVGNAAATAGSTHTLSQVAVVPLSTTTTPTTPAASKATGAAIPSVSVPMSILSSGITSPSTPVAATQSTATPLMTSSSLATTTVTDTAKPAVVTVLVTPDASTVTADVVPVSTVMVTMSGGVVINGRAATSRVAASSMSTAAPEYPGSYKRGLPPAPEPEMFKKLPRADSAKFRF